MGSRYVWSLSFFLERLIHNLNQLITYHFLWKATVNAPKLDLYILKTVKKIIPVLSNILNMIFNGIETYDCKLRHFTYK